MSDAKKTERVTLCLDEERRERLERIALERESRAGVRLSRGEILRLVIDRGMEALERMTPVPAPARARVDR